VPRGESNTILPRQVVNYCRHCGALVYMVDEGARVTSCQYEYDLYLGQVIVEIEKEDK